MKERLKALVITANPGRALMPLTGQLPRPLLPIGGMPLVQYALKALAAVGCRSALVATTEPRPLEDVLGFHLDPLAISYSALDSGRGQLGALLTEAKFFREADAILIVDGDRLCRWPLRQLLRAHRRSGAEATALVQHLDSDRPAGIQARSVRLGPKGHLLSLGGFPQAPASSKRAALVGVHVLSPDLLSRLAQQSELESLEADLYPRLLRNRALCMTKATRRPVYSTDTLESILRASYGWAQNRSLWKLGKRSFFAGSVERQRGCRVVRSLIEEGVSLGARSRVEDSYLLDGVRVGPRSQLSQCIVGPGVELPPETHVARRLITPLRAGRDPRGRDSVVGELVYTPLVG